MKSRSPIKRFTSRAILRTTGLLAALAAGVLLGNTGQAAEDMYQTAPHEGGVPAQSVINSISVTPTNATLCWYGLRGWYTIEGSTNGTSFNPVTRQMATTFANCATVTNSAGYTMFRLNQANNFEGSGACAGCHGDKYNKWQATPHAAASADLENVLRFMNVPESVKEGCRVCHNIGKGEPTGFVSVSATPQLANVGCENCHGAAGWHKYSDHELIRPAVSIAPEICGGCHTDDHHPTYEEYSETKHAQVNDDIKYGVSGGVYYPGTIVLNGTTLYGYYVTTNANGTLKTNATSGIIHSSHIPGSAVDPGNDRSTSCGICHSAATRLAMLNNYNDRFKGYTNALALPTAHDAGEWTATCANCHDPHEFKNPAQLRNPLRSTNYYTMASLSDKRTVLSTNWAGTVSSAIVYSNTTFASLYDPNVQVCGQCHNTRGARWDGLAYGLITNGANIYVGVTTNVTGYSRPPHHSPQYNMLIGIVQPDYLTTNSLGVATNFTARHSGFTGTPYNTNQCATCHMPSYAIDAEHNVTGHTFELNKLGCGLAGCHTSGVPDVEGQQTTTTNNLSRLVALLNQWATSKAPALLGPTAYNTSKENSWEFTTPGALGSVTNAGPSTANQLKLPESIRQARFNAYMVLHDGSMGVHNPGYSRLLLTDAENKVLGQLDGARFKVNNPQVFVNTAIWFTNLNPATATAVWDFGDSSTLNAGLAAVSHAYTTSGVYTVSLTTTDTNNVVTTSTRTNYLIIYDRPVPSFTMSASSGKAPLTVNFTNTSANATYQAWLFMNPTRGVGLFSNEQNPSFTYTNAGTYQVKLTAYNEGGNVAITNTVTVSP